jgi:hypothetical protein
MLEHLEKLRPGSSRDKEDADDTREERFRTLRFFTAELLVTAGLQASLRFLRERSTPPKEFGVEEPDTSVTRSVLELAPVVLGPAAAAAQALRAVHPSERAETATRLFDALVIGVGAAGVLESLSRAVRGDGSFSFNPLLFGYIGVLGLLLDREETELREETEQLRRRASLVERWLPKRRTRIQRIVVHV